MFAVFAYLTSRSIRNRVIAMGSQLRNPRYAVALLFGAAYIGWFIINGTMTGGDGSRSPLDSVAVELLATVGLLVLFMRWWLFGNDRSALAFSPAEIQFLFPAPVTRRALIQYKLLRAQIAILFNVLLWVLILRGGASALPSALRAISIWALFTIFMLHRLGATIVRSAAMQHGAAGARRNTVALALFGVVATGLLWSVVQGYPAVRDATGPREVLNAITALLQQPVPHALLAPFRTLLAPTFARTAGEWARDILPVLLVVGLHYVWVIRTELAFEDAAVEASAQRARRIEAMRARRAGAAQPVRAGSRSWIPLPSRGHHGVAILWKNLIAFTRTPGQSFVVIVIVVTFAAMAAIISVAGEGGFVSLSGFFALALAGFSILVGARFVRLDLRQDLLHLGLLRTYPIEGSALVAAEVAGSTLVLTVVQMLLLAGAHVLLLSQPDLAIGVRERWMILAVAPLVLVILNAASVTIQNAAALLFPAWVRLGTAKSGGVEVLGQSILTTIASLIAFGLALIPPGIAAVAIFAGVQLVLPGALLVAASAALVAGLAALAFEVGMAMMLLGEVFERGDLSGSSTS